MRQACRDSAPPNAARKGEPEAQSRSRCSAVALSRPAYVLLFEGSGRGPNELANRSFVLQVSLGAVGVDETQGGAKGDGEGQRNGDGQKNYFHRTSPPSLTHRDCITRGRVRWARYISRWNGVRQGVFAILFLNRFSVPEANRALRGEELYFSLSFEGDAVCVARNPREGATERGWGGAGIQ
jgi:hypothetical protein